MVDNDMAAQPAGFGLATLSEQDGRRFPALVKGDRYVDLSARASTVLELLEAWPDELPRLREIATGLPASGAVLSKPRVHAPLIPRQIFQAGMNYRTHVLDLRVANRSADDPRTADEIRAEAAADLDRRAATGKPFQFLGLPSAIAGPTDDLVLPSYSQEHDWELELGVVIGAEAFRVDADRALDHVAGYLIGNDITTRDLATGPRAGPGGMADWFSGKNAPGFLPLGPYLVPAEFVADPMDLRITLSLNGEVKQDESTKNMIFGIAAQIAAASRITRLLTGDLLLTGSPAGNGKHWGRMLRPGDVMQGSINGLGRQIVRCVAEPPSTAHS